MDMIYPYWISVESFGYKQTGVLKSLLGDAQVVNLSKFGFTQIFHFKSRLKMVAFSSISRWVPMILRSSTYTNIIQNPVENFLMNTHGQSSLLENPFRRRNSFSWLYHILPNYFKSYNDFWSFTQYMLREWFLFGISIPSGKYIYIYIYLNLVAHMDMLSLHPWDAWIGLFVLPMILDIGMLYHS
jgi:hypothetical protein